MKASILLVFSLCILCMSCQGQGNRPAVSSGDTVTALGGSILLIYQAANGDYWFGSDGDGVYRYNGKYIVHFTEKDGLAHNRIRSIQEDRQGHIFIATLGGINKYDGQRFETLSAIPGRAEDHNWKLQPDDLWFSMTGRSGDKGPYRYDGTHLYQLEFPKHHLADSYFATHPDAPWSPYEVYSIYKDSKGSMWFGTGNLGVCRYDGTSWSWLYEDQLTHVPNGGSFGIRSVTEDRDGNFWICNTNFQYRISDDPVHKQDTALIAYQRLQGIAGIRSSNGIDGVYFMSAIQDTAGHLWLATYDQGVWRYDGKTAQQYLVKEGDKTVTLYSVYQDRNGHIWLGTHSSGTYQFNGQTFDRFRP